MNAKEKYTKSSIFDCYGNLIRRKNLETKNIVIYEKSYKDSVINSTRYGHGKTITMLNLYYHKVMGKIKEYEGKEYLIVGNYVLDKVLGRFKKIIDIEEFDKTKILIDTDDILPDNITFRNAVVLITSVIKDDGKFYPQLKKHSMINKHGNNI